MTTTLPALRPVNLGPLESVVPAPFGRFRGPVDLCQIRATSDLEAVASWLAEYADSPNTYANYRKEVDRLIRWAAAQPEPLPLSGLTRDDLLLYEVFMADPQPADDWVGPPVPRSHPNWKPFSWRRGPGELVEEGGRKVLKRRGGLVPESRRQALDVLHSLFSYLQSMGYMAINPLSVKGRRGRRKKKAQKRSVKRYLDRDTWDFLVGYIEALPRTTLRDEQHYRRVRWLFYLLYLTRVRRAEVAGAKMVDFYRDDVDDLWYWHVLGKGEKEREVPVSAELLDEYIAYRRFHRLPDYPSPHEDKPLVLSIKGTSGLTPKAVYLIVKEVCMRASRALAQLDPMRASKLELATTHWLRHTSATHFVNEGGDLRVAQETLGHDDINTTMEYQHVEKTDMHRQSSRLRIKRAPQ